ncbi:MAG: HD domain-containing protein [Rhodoferax sp.]|nr:HD domain-containing protein [Rhodoferax sp.]
MSLTVPEIVELLSSRATTWYGQEAVSQLEHALQCAHLAERANEAPETVVAALLHDLGHMLGANREASVDNDAAPTKDDLHQFVALPFLRGRFPDAVLEPIRLHVDAKRYLCAVDAGYWAGLSPASKHSLELQGGRYDDVQVRDFENLTFYAEAVRLRRYDDQAKVPGQVTPPLSHYADLMAEISDRG